MCLAIPGVIVEITGFNAKVDIMGFQYNVNIQLLNEPKVDDCVLVHAGAAIEKIEAEYYSFLEQAFMKSLSEDDENE